MLIQEGVSLKEYNTFKVEVIAQFYAEVHTTEELVEALRFAIENNINFLILGGGSNILFTQNFLGLVIAVRILGIIEKQLDENHVLITAKAGENWHQFVKYCIAKNYGGLENLALIPGNVGASPIQNIGAYGTEMKDTFRHCKVMNANDFSIKTMYLKECNFGYRDSIFNNSATGHYIVLEVSFLLTTKEHKVTTAYGGIQAELDNKNITRPDIKDISDAVITIRKKKLPDPAVIGNAGSFFKNPIISSKQFSNLEMKFGLIPNYSIGNNVKIAAGWLIEHSGWKGKTIGNVGCHPLQALVIINATGNATGKEILEFSSQIINSVKDKFGIELEREVYIF